MWRRPEPEDADEAAEARQSLTRPDRPGPDEKEFLSCPGNTSIVDAVADVAVRGQEYPSTTAHIFVWARSASCWASPASRTSPVPKPQSRLEESPRLLMR